ncbi:MAG: dihydropteroate synthase, partial [Desulfobacterales bacterium]|nr:dihydropteroate synthase [Desulfobacterales bacterium]
MLDSPKTYRFSWSGYDMEFGRRTCIMGVVNVTPDSFSDGGKFFARDAAVAQGQKLAADGADILDIGGESTRPFSDPVSADEEIERVIPVIEKLADQLTIPISIDTMKAEVARRAIDAGASMINDVSALRFDP